MSTTKNNDHNRSKIIADRRTHTLSCRLSGKREPAEISGIRKSVLVSKSLSTKSEVENCNFSMNCLFLIIIYLK